MGKGLPFTVQSPMRVDGGIKISALRANIEAEHGMEARSLQLFQDSSGPAFATGSLVRDIGEHTLTIRRATNRQADDKEQQAVGRVLRKRAAGKSNAKTTKHHAALERRLGGIGESLTGVETAVGEVGSTRNPGSLYALMDTSGN